MSLQRRRATDCESQVAEHQETGREMFFNPDVPSQENPGLA